MNELPIYVIRREDVQPGDMIMIKCRREDSEAVHRKGCRCRVGIIWDSMDIQVIRQEEQEKSDE